MPTALVIPPKLRESLSPRRSQGLQPKTEAEIERELAAMSKSYSKNVYAQKPKSKILEEGCKSNKEPALRKARRDACELLPALSLAALREASLDTLAAAELMFRWNNYKHRDQSLIGGVALARGLGFAIDVHLRMLGLHLEPADWKKGGYTYAVCVVSAKEGTVHEIDDWERAAEPLREVVCRAPEAEYKAARKHAADLRKKLDPLTRAHLAYIFPDESWAREDLRACLDHAKKQADPEDYAGHFAPLLGVCGDIEIIREFRDAPHDVYTSGFALDWVASLPEADALSLLAQALPGLLTKPKYGPLLKSPPRAVVSAIACLRTPAAADVLAPYFGHAIVGPIVADFFKDAPELQGALEAQAKGKSKAAEAAAHLLETAKAKRPTGPVAKEGDVPALLRERPWRPRKGRIPPRTVKLAIPAGAEERVELSEADRDVKFDPGGSPVRDMTAKELEAWRRAVKKKEYAHADYDFDYKSNTYLRVPEEEGLRAWNEARAFAENELAYLVRHGVAAIPGFLNRAWIDWLNYAEVDNDYFGVMDRIVTPRLGPQMARVMERRKKFRREAQAWLLRHPGVAARGLLPDAFGKPGQAREDAEQALLFLAYRGETKTLEAAARAYGPEAEKALADLLARDPLAIDATPPKPPAFLRMGELPAVRTKQGARLPEQAMDALVELLRVSPLDPPYAGVAKARDALDEATLGALARELLEQWVLGGANGRFEWMIFANAHFPSDGGTRRVASLARDWARRDRSKARRACATLAAIGSDLALLHLGHIAETSRFEDLRKDARGLLDEAAALRGLTRDELEDRIVPDLDLGADGTIRLSYGARSFVVSLDEGLRPIVRDESGASLPTLPRATKTDDAAQAKAARARFDAFKRDAEQVADRQLRRLEAAMVAGREWSRDDFLARVAHHPLLAGLARRLVWDALSGARVTEFRVAEDGSFADARDGAVVLEQASRVRIAHPARMTDSSRAGWSQLLADYKLAQPFEQLGRAVYTPTSAERGATKIERAAGVKVPATKVLGLLESRGWRRDDRGFVGAYLRPARGSAIDLCIPISPGISMEDLKGAPEQTALAIELRGAASKGATFGAIDPIDFSEAVRDALALGS